MTREIYDEEEVVVGFEEPTVTSANKCLFLSHQRWPEIKPGSNAIIMGDLIEDMGMAKNLELKQVIRVGFFNAPPISGSELLKKYMKSFDVLIMNDGNLTRVAELVAAIAGLEVEAEADDPEGSDMVLCTTAI